MEIAFAIYGFIDLILLLAAKVINERVKPILQTMGTSKNRKLARQRENAVEGICQLEEPLMRFTKINAKGQVTIPADLRERFGMTKGTRIDWKKDGHRLVLIPIPPVRRKS